MNSLVRFAAGVLFSSLLFCLSSIHQAQQTETASPKNTTPPRLTLRLVGSYFPLRVGNRWTYEWELNGKKQPKPVVVEITRMVIKNFRSYYVFNRFPFAPSGESQFSILRYDHASQKFYQLIGEDTEQELFPTDETHRVELTAGEAPGGGVDLRTLKLRFEVAEKSGALSGAILSKGELIFKHQEGLIAALLITPRGTEKYTLSKGEANVFVSGQEKQARGLVTHEEVPETSKQVPYAREGPRLELLIEPLAGWVKFSLHVQNDQNKMIPLDFASAQSFDFIVTAEGSDQPLWRWSAGRYFTKVKRSLGLQPSETREFTAEWNGLDFDRQPVSAGKYRVVGVLTSTPEHKTPPVEFKYTPPSMNY